MTALRGAVVVSVSALAIALTLAIGASGEKSDGVVRPTSESTIPGSAGSGLVFTDHRGHIVSEEDWKGEFLLVFFGYTHCPDVCPTGLQVMSTALRRLGTPAEHIRPVFISLDPARDTPEVLREYVRHFHPRLLGLTGTDAQIHAAARAYDVLYVRRESDETGGYAINHEADFYLVGPEGEAIAILDDDIGVDGLVTALEEYLDRHSRGAGHPGGDS